MKKLITLCFIFSFLITPNLVAQQTVYLQTGGSGDGTSESTPYGSFNTALAEINSAGDKLIIIGTISLQGINLTSKSFAFTIEGLNSSSTLEGNGGTSRLFTINGATSADVTLKNLTFSSFNTTLAGGGVFYNNNAGATATFENCTFTGNSVTNNNGGGAIFSANGTLHIIESSFENNTSSDEGGAIFANSGTITITNTLFKTNSAATKGGAIYTTNGDFTISGSTFYDNETTGAGGGSAFYVASSGSTNSITKCTFFQNTTANTNQDYGTIRTDNGNTTVTNSLFYDNKTNNNSGGYSDWGSGPGGTQTFNTSIAQWISTNVDNQDEGNGSITGIKGGGGTAADLTNSSLSWDTTLNKIIFTAPNALTDNSPIDFGSDTEDVGAWDSKINIFKATTNNVWNETTNWSNGALPTSTDNVAVLSGAEVTLNTDATIVDLKVKSPIKINFGESLIVTGEVSGDDNKVYYKRILTAIAGDAEGWHLVASPVSGETYDDAFVTAEGIASGTGNNRGIASYVTDGDSWDYMQSGESETFTSGHGYAMKRASTGQVKFIGNLNTDDTGVDATISTAGNGFNLLGNPYTAFINSQTFLNNNNSELQQQIWVWDQDNGGNYEVKVLADDFEIAPGQGFFVKAISGTAVNFAESNQSAQGTDTFLRTNSWTEVKLLMTDGEKNRFTKLYFTDNATTGFDAGWEGEVFGGVQNEIDVFTHLVEESQGKKYQVQSLPLSDLESLVIPVGVITEAGKTATFSIENTNVPSNINVYIEDKQDNSFTLLEADSNFSFTPENNLDGIGRFYIHTTTNSLSADDFGFNNTLSIYTSSRENLRVVGVKNGTANIQLYNILGKEVLRDSFEGNGVNDIALPKLNSGVYIVKIVSETGITNKKIIIQ